MREFGSKGFPTPETPSVLIVGAGPTGLALACDLRGRGIPVTIIDKALVPATTSRALGLQPRGAEILDRIGALGDLPQRAVNALAVNFLSGGQQLIRIEVPAGSGITNPGPLIIGQSEIEGQLRSRLREFQTKVIWGCELVAIQNGGRGIKATLRAGGTELTVCADWLVGCDGAHSIVRKLSGIGFEGTAFAEKFVLADVRLDWSRPRREVAVWAHKAGMFAAMPLPGRDIWRLMVELPAGGDPLPADPNGSIQPNAAIAPLQRLLEERTGDTGTRVSDPSWVSLFRFHRRIASAYRCGRVLIAGDAAHIHSPFGGQGMNTGLGDAYNLGWKLALVIQGRAAEGLLDTYEAERRPVAADVLATTTNNTNIVLGNTRLSRFLRDHVVLRLMRMPAVQRKLTAKGSQLNVTYRGGPLALAPRALARLACALRPGPKAGDRGPNAPCVLRPSEKVTTLGKQTSSGFALLLFGGPADELSACAAALRSRFGTGARVVRVLQRGDCLPDGAEFVDTVIEDHCGAIARLYRPGSMEVILLRPDGHLGCRFRRPDAAGLRRWLDEALEKGRGERCGRRERAVEAPARFAGEVPNGRVRAPI